MNIYLVRHPQSEICIDPEQLKKAGYPTDLAVLTEVGEKQIAITAQELNQTLQDAQKVVILCSPNHRTIQAAKIIAEGLDYHQSIRIQDFLSEIGQGPIGELNGEQIDALRKTNPELVEQQEAARKRLKQSGANHYRSKFPLDKNTPSEIEGKIKNPLLEYLENERQSGTEAVIIVGNAGNMLLVEKILAGHSEGWFNEKFAQQNRPPRGSITELVLKENEVTEAGFNDLGVVFMGEQSERMQKAGLGGKS